MQRENTLISSEASRGPIDQKGNDAPKSGGTYMVIPPGAIIPGSLPKFKIYVPLPNGQYVLWTPDGETVTPDQLARLSASGQKEVYVALDEKIKYEEYLESHLGPILESSGASDEQKAAVFSTVSTNLVRDAFETSLGMGAMSADVLARTRAMIERALIFIAESRSLEALAKMVGHDYETYEHSTKVLWFAMAFLKDNPDVLEAIRAGCGDFDRDKLGEILKSCGVAALLHDIGKALISRELLHKAEPLTEMEWETMKIHPLSGLAMLVDTDVPSFVKKAVLQHHEDFHGRGYPMGLDGEKITTLARVLRVIDVFDAMTSRRPYKEALSPVKAAEIMVGKAVDGSYEPDRRDQGMQQCFDPKILRKFIVFLGHARLSL
jgi:HD-GYP domain-containing protein (c-di-GMP phosphodiesterase class II)